jgi:hypothetical protein
MTTQLLIDDRLSGIPEVAHGGYVSGLIAQEIEGATAEIRLRRPVPTGRHLSLDRNGGGRAELRDGEVTLADGSAANLALAAPGSVTALQAAAAADRFPGFTAHPFPHCLACGPDHPEGLHIFPGPVAGRRLVAATWVPPDALADDAGHVTAPFVWAALDCPQLWALIVHAPAQTTDRVVTAALGARVERPVLAGEPHVVIGWPIGRRQGRWLAGAAVFGPRGELCAIGRQTAAVADWGVPLGRDRLAMPSQDKGERHVHDT